MESIVDIVEKESDFIQKTKKNMKKGFTLLEIVMSIILLAVVAYMVYPNIIAGKDKSEITSALNADAKSIMLAVSEWKSTDTKNSDGTFNALTNLLLVPYLPTSLRYDSVSKAIVSSAINVGGSYTNPKGIKYTVVSDTTPSGSAGDSFKIFIDFADIDSAKNLNDTLTQYAEKTAMNAIAQISTNVDVSGKVGQTPLATAIGTKNTAFSVTGGTDTDGMCGVRYLRF
jgi:prepilin-type N-terminal cleavage/methylation domain-containing protein